MTIFVLIFTELESKHEFVVKVRDMVKTWPRPIFVVMRYLFAFLNHLSEFRYVKLYETKSLYINYIMSNAQSLDNDYYCLLILVMKI